MFKTIIIDKNEDSRNSIAKILGTIKNIEYKGCFSDFLQAKEIINDVDLIIFDVDSKNVKTVLAEIDKVENRNINFIATSYEINSQLVNEVLGNNIKDFLLKPLILPILEASIKKLSSYSTPLSKTIAVFSNKGAIGKTSLAVNLAYEISQKTNEKVCLLDFSFNGEDASTFLDIKPRASFSELMEKINSFSEENLLSYLNRYKNSSLYVLADKDDLSPNSLHSPELVNKIINYLKNIFSYVIIDTSSIIDETNVNILNNSDIVLLMCLGNMPSIRNCQKCCELFDKIGYSNDKIKLIINRYIENAEISLEDISKVLNKSVFAKIPNNYLTLIDAINLGQTLKEINPQSNIGKAYGKIADDILKIDFLNLENNKNYNHGIFNLLKRMGEE